MIFQVSQLFHFFTSLVIGTLLFCNSRFKNACPVTATLLPILTCTALPATATILHLPLHRRGGSFNPCSDPSSLVDLDFLYGELRRLDARFNQTTREFKGNRLARTPRKDDAGGRNFGEEGLMGDIQTDGAWLVPTTPPFLNSFGFLFVEK